MNDAMNAQRDKLVQDLRLVINDAETLLRSGGEQLGDGAAQWRSQTQARLGELRERLVVLQHQTTDRVRAAGRSTNEFVHRNPWAAVGLSSGFGLLVGVLMRRR